MLDFQAQQDRARGRTTVLVLLYAAGLAVVAALTAPVFVALAVLVTSERSRQVDRLAQAFAHPVEFVTTPAGAALTAVAAAFTLGVMLVATLHRFVVLREGGGAVVARDMGASLIAGGSDDPARRRLLNIVEEVAIASSVPVPPVYLLEREPGINAFAAGYAPGDAVVVVTAGALRHLTRDQLQGVIAHEFSHILNGDMRLNIRLVALLHGIVALSLIGRLLMESSRDSRRSGLVLIPAGALVFAVGSIGAAVAGLIRAAVSRQREFLADASAVEYTRNPQGLAGALRTIGGFALRGRVRSPRAAECSHMFFADSRPLALSGVLGSHPPLADRIRRLDPGWDGSFPRVVAPVDEGWSAPPTTAAHAAGSATAAALVGTPAAGRPAPSGWSTAAPKDPLAAVGTLIAAAPEAGPAAGWSAGQVLARIREARTTLDAIHPDLLRAARDSFDAQALVLGMLLSRRPEVSQAQQRAVAEGLGGAAAARAVALQRVVLAAGKEARLPLALLAMGTLAGLSGEQYRSLRGVLDGVLGANARMDLFKLCLQRMVEAHLDHRHGGDARPVVQYYALTRLAPEVSTLLSAVAMAGGPQGLSEDGLDVLVRRAGDPLRVPGVSRVPPAGLTARGIHDALGRLAEASPALRRRVVEACAVVAGADGVLAAEERELVSAIADALEVPLR